MKSVMLKFFLVLMALVTVIAQTDHVMSEEEQLELSPKYPLKKSSESHRDYLQPASKNRLNLTLETSLIFDAKDIKKDILNLNQVKFVIDQLHAALVPRPLGLRTKSNTDKNVVISFLRRLGKKLVQLKGNYLVNLTEALDLNIEDHNADTECSFHNIVSDEKLKKYLLYSVQKWSKSKAEELQKSIKYALEEDNRFTDFLNAIDRMQIYDVKDAQTLTNIFKKFATNRKSLSSYTFTVNEALHYAIFDKYEKLSKDVKSKLADEIKKLSKLIVNKKIKSYKFESEKYNRAEEKNSNEYFQQAARTRGVTHFRAQEYGKFQNGELHLSEMKDVDEMIRNKASILNETYNRNDKMNNEKDSPSKSDDTYMEDDESFMNTKKIPLVSSVNYEKENYAPNKSVDIDVQDGEGSKNILKSTKDYANDRMDAEYSKKIQKVTNNEHPDRNTDKDIAEHINDLEKDIEIMETNNGDLKRDVQITTKTGTNENSVRENDNFPERRKMNKLDESDTDMINTIFELLSVKNRNEMIRNRASILNKTFNRSDKIEHEDVPFYSKSNSSNRSTNPKASSQATESELANIIQKVSSKARESEVPNINTKVSSKATELKSSFTNLKALNIIPIVPNDTANPKVPSTATIQKALKRRNFPISSETGIPTIIINNRIVYVTRTTTRSPIKV